MEEPLEQEHSMTNDDLKPSSSSTTTKSSRSTKTTTVATNGSTRRHKRRRQTNSTRSSSDHSSSSSRSSSSSSHSSHLSLKNLPSNDQESKTSRSCLAQEQLQIIVDKTKTGKYDILDSFAFLSFETDDDWRIAFEHFHQQQLQQSFANKKSYSLSGKKNGNLSEHIDGHSLHRSISVPCKIEDGHRIHHLPSSAPVDDTSIENHRSSMWQNLSPNKNSADRQSMTTIKSEPTDRTNRSSRTTSEHDENHFDIERNQNSIISSRKSNDDIRIESGEKKHHHHHNHHHHKSHKRHKTKHDLSVNGDSSNKHPTITSMSDLAKQHIKHEPIPLPPSLNFPSYFDPKLFSLPSYPPFAHPSHLPPSFPGSYEHQLMLARGLHTGQYPRDMPMPPPPRPPSRSLQHPFSLKENHPDSMEKMIEKLYPGVFPSYFAAATAGASNNNNSPVSSMNVKMHGPSPNGPDHHLWSHRDALQRQFLAASNKPSSTKSPLFDSNTKLPPNHAGPSPTDHHRHHHHRRHSSSQSNPDIPNPTTPTGHPLYLAPVIVTEFHQHQHNHNHTHEHKLNITTKDDRQTSPRSKTPLSNENKKPKAGFSVTDMFVDKTSPITKHSPQSQGFLSVINNKKESNTSSLISLKKSFSGKWSTAHVHIAWMIYNNQQRQQRDDLNHHNSSNKIRSSTSFIPPSSSSSQSALLPPPLPLADGNGDLSLLRPPMPPPFSFPFDINSQQNNLFRPPSATKLTRPTVTSASSSSSSSLIKPPTIQHEQKTPFTDDRLRRTSPSPLSRPTSRSNFLPSSPSHRMRMDYPSLLLPPPPPPPPPSQHQQSPFSMNDERKRFMSSNADLLSQFGPNPFLSSLFPMNAPPMPPPPPQHHSNSSSSSSSRRSGIHSDSPKSSLFPLPPPPSSNPFDFTRSPLLTPGLPLPNNHFESDRYRFLLEQQARDRGLQFAMMAAAAGNAPPPNLFTDPNSSALFKPF